jgi:hypothetical protein
VIYNPHIDLVFGIFLILVPFLVLGGLALASVLYVTRDSLNSQRRQPTQEEDEQHKAFARLIDILKTHEDLFSEETNREIEDILSILKQ